MSSASVSRLVGRGLDARTRIGARPHRRRAHLSSHEAIGPVGVIPSVRDVLAPAPPSWPLEPDAWRASKVSYGGRKTGSWSGATSSSMLRAAPGRRRIKPLRSRVRIIWWTGWRDLEVSLEVRLRRRATVDASVGPDKGQVLALGGRKGRLRERFVFDRFLVHPTISWFGEKNARMTSANWRV